MTRTTRICPHCKGTVNYGSGEGEYNYGSPFRICPHCKKTYVDRTYHEIAVEGIRKEDLSVRTEEDRKKDRRTGIIVGIVSSIGFIVALCFGLILFPLPLIAIFGFGKAHFAKKEDVATTNEKKMHNLEIEREQSEARMQNPNYVAMLRKIGYINTLPESYQPAESVLPSNE